MIAAERAQKGLVKRYTPRMIALSHPPREGGLRAFTPIDCQFGFGRNSAIAVDHRGK